MSAQELKNLLEDNNTIVIVQADNPDGDSLASSLALEQILHNMGKQPHMYCGVDIPKHLRHLPGWDRVEKDIPHRFDMGIIVDCSSRSLLEIADTSGQLAWLLSKPLVIIDHHDIKPTIDATLIINQHQAVATGEVIYTLAHELNWPLSHNALTMMASSILSDSLGLMTEATTAQSIRIIADLVEQGVSLPKLEEARRETMRKSKDLTRYKGKLLERIEYHHNDQIASVTIPWEEIEKYSSQYNPSILVLEDMRLTDNVKVAIAFKTYPNGRVTAKIRANFGYPIAKKLAEHFGAGGHPYASGFKVTSKPFNNVKTECLEVASRLLDELGNTNEAL